MTEFSKKRALITGAARGIGAAIALDLAERGADVAFTYSTEAAAELVRKIEAKGRRAYAIRADIGDGSDVKRSVDEAATLLGGLDILVNNAGILFMGFGLFSTLRPTRRALPIRMTN